MRERRVKVTLSLLLPPGYSLRELCSPELYADVASGHHGVAGLAVERGGERRQVRHGAVGTELARRMRIAVDHLFQRIRRLLVAIEHGIDDEEALVAAESVDHRNRPAGGGCIHRVVGPGHSTEVGDVSAQGQVAVSLTPVQKLVGIEG